MPANGLEAQHLAFSRRQLSGGRREEMGAIGETPAYGFSSHKIGRRVDGAVGRSAPISGLPNFGGTPVGYFFYQDPLEFPVPIIWGHFVADIPIGGLSRISPRIG
jgi:hypothetical protein